MTTEFHANTRAEIKELEAKIRNYDTDMQSMEEAHKAQIKVYMQRVRHLEYEFTNQAKKVKNDATKFMKEEKTEHTKND